jgi:metallo-beta-lactamase family protein
MDLAFLGGAGTVTGSKYLVESDGARVLVDCGLFQGFKALRRRNWARFPVDPASIDAVLLTHAHIDHTGYLPVLARNGFSGPVYATAATADLCNLLWPDSARLQEEDAEYANRKGFSKHKPALPLYTEEDAARALTLLRPVDFDAEMAVSGPLRATFRPAGHILGAASIVLRDDATSVLFSGDLGRDGDLTMPPPAAPGPVAHVVMESTYGDRTHDPADVVARLGEVVSDTARRGGIVLVPAFAVGRTQNVLYALHLLRDRGDIPDVPVYLNSPMAVSTTELYVKHAGQHSLPVDETDALVEGVTFVRSVEESKALNRLEGPAVVVSASGMLTGGRVTHHLKAYAPSERNTLLFVGYQAPGTRGSDVLGGAERVKLHGDWVPIRCRIAEIPGFSAHADRDELVSWLGKLPAPPSGVYLTHGEPEAAERLRVAIRDTLGWEAEVPEHGSRVTLRAAPAVAAAPPVAVPGDGDAARRVAAVMHHPAYLMAEEDHDFLDRDEARPHRLALEYLKAESELTRRGISATVVVFGSTRILDPEVAAVRLAEARAAGDADPDDRAAAEAVVRAEEAASFSRFYREAREFGRLAATETFDDHRRAVVVTGGGPGIMEAANRGAFDVGEATMGLNITLPHEQFPNPYVTPGLGFRFRYFAIRKMHFTLRAAALVAFPGGYGTLDELFEMLTLTQTGKMEPIPIVLVGREHWEQAVDLRYLEREGFIDRSDLGLFHYAEGGREAWRIIQDHYRKPEGRAAEQPPGPGTIR